MDRRLLCLCLLASCAVAACNAEVDFQVGTMETTTTRPMGADHTLKTHVRDDRGRVSIVPADDEDASGVEVATFAKVKSLRAGPVPGGVEVCADAAPQRRPGEVELADGRRLTVVYACTSASELPPPPTSPAAAPATSETADGKTETRRNGVTFRVTSG